MSSAMQKNAGHSHTLSPIALLGAVAVSLTWGCVSSKSDSNGTGGTAAATGGAITSSGGTTGSGGAGQGGTTAVGGGGVDSGTLPPATACPTPTVPLIADFTYTPTDAGTSATKASFGGDSKTTFSGSTWYYPDPTSVPTPKYPLTSDVSGSNWHITGTVGDYSGLGLYWNNSCALVDASAFKGISMTISSAIPGTSLYLSVNTAEDTITTAWYAKYATVAATFGTCNPSGSNQYDGTCNAPSKLLPMTATPTTVTVLWADLTGGKPNPSVTPSKLTGITFYFNWSSSMTPYPIDVTIDDLSFVQ